MDNDSERRKQLKQTMKKFNKGQGNSILGFGIDSEDKEVIPTGIPAIDKFVGGGTKRGTFTVIYGGQSVGKSTLVLQAIASAQKEGKICCYVDLEHTFDKGRATSFGVNLDELILAEKCEHAEQALEIIRALCKDKVVDLIAVDSIQAMATKGEKETKTGKERALTEKNIAELARVMSEFFRKVSPDVFNAKASVIMIGQVRIAGIGSFYTHADMTGGEALKHWAYVRLFLRKGQRADAPGRKEKVYFLDPDGGLHFQTRKVDVGFDCVVKLEKTKNSNSAKEGADIHVPFYTDTGFVAPEVTEEIPIVVEAEKKEDEEKIEKMLIEKGVVHCEYFANTMPTIEDDTLTITKCDDDLGKVDENAKVEDVLKPKKKKRGRPKKVKK